MTTEVKTLLENVSLESTDSTYSYSDKQPGAGYYKNGDGLHTVYYSFNDFIGSVKLQGTLAQYPGENDWVDIDNTQVGLGEDSTVFANSNQDANFTGKFIWIRAAYNIQNGTINTIRFNC